MNGQEIIQSAVKEQDNIINLKDALKESLKKMEDQKPPKKPGGRKKAATA